MSCEAYARALKQRQAEIVEFRRLVWRLRCEAVKLNGKWCGRQASDVRDGRACCGHHYRARTVTWARPPQEVYGEELPLHYKPRGADGE